MIFTNLALNNIGPYRGKHEFNLKPEVDGVNSKPVILFGGLNGAGKTQILESIKLVLYGSASIGTRVTLTKYHDLLKRNKIKLKMIKKKMIKKKNKYLDRMNEFDN